MPSLRLYCPCDEDVSRMALYNSQLDISSFKTLSSRNDAFLQSLEFKFSGEYYCVHSGSLLLLLLLLLLLSSNFLICHKFSVIML